MARITVEDCLEVVDNRFELVLMATKRARQLEKGAEMIDEIDRVERERAEREALEWAATEVDDDLSKGGDD